MLTDILKRLLHSENVLSDAYTHTFVTADLPMRAVP